MKNAFLFVFALACAFSPVKGTNNVCTAEESRDCAIVHQLASSLVEITRVENLEDPDIQEFYCCCSNTRVNCTPDGRVSTL